MLAQHKILPVLQSDLVRDVRVAENPQKRCFCIDVTSDNLLDAVRQTVEDETLSHIKRRDAELTAELREAVAEELPLSTKVARFEALQEPTPLEMLATLESARTRKAAAERQLELLHAALPKFKGLGHCDIDLIEPGSGTQQKLASNLRKRAVALLRAGSTYEAAHLDKNPSGPPTSTPLVFSVAVGGAQPSA